MMRLTTALFVLLSLSACSSPDDIATAEAELTSADPCHVQTSPYNPQCTNAWPVASWNCAGYNSQFQTCYKAQGTNPIPGTYFIFEPTPPPVLPSSHANIWPAWTDDTIPHTSTGHQPTMEVPPGTQIAFPDLLPSGWSYNKTDLSPHTPIYGLMGMIWEYVEIQDGGGICLYAGDYWTNQLGCWGTAPGGYFRIEPYLYGNVAVHSFYTW